MRISDWSSDVCSSDLIGIAGFGAAALAAGDELRDQPRLASLRDRLERDIGKLYPEAVVHGRAAARVAGTSCIAMASVPAEAHVMAFDLAGIAVSSGAATTGERRVGKERFSSWRYRGFPLP